MDQTELKDLRTRLALTQSELAKEVGVSANTLARWERGESPVSEAADTLIRHLAIQQPKARAVSWAHGDIRDPYHQKIVEALNGHLDPDVFEACAVDLLKSSYPTLVPISGGSDEGFDGAVGQSTSDPFPLITTTGKAPRDNLRRNLKKSVDSGWEIRRSIFATSRRITPAMRKKLFYDARSLDIQLVQIYDQTWFANALYRDSFWCQELLSLTGKPSALSVYPVGQRIVLGDQVIGRDKEIEKLRDIDRDCLILGGPGSGKTFLLRALALEGRALFLVDQDREAIANAVREQKPTAIIVDDAQLDDQRLTSLTQLRNEIGADYRIIAVSWPAEANRVDSVLNLTSSDYIPLELIDADTMVDVIKSAGIYGPNGLIASIVRQAEGRPGLATTLVFLCLNGDMYDVLSGEALAKQFGQIIDQEASQLLGVFALGGKAGLVPDLVSSYLRMSRLQISSKLASLAAAGLVHESHDGSVSVWPATLRWVLVRNTFFGGLDRIHDYSALFHQLPNKEEAVETLIGARSRGANIPDLEALLESQHSSNLWSEYASLGPGESNVALSRHPEFAIQLAASALHNSPELILPRLFDLAQGDGRQLHNTLEHPLRKIKDWVTGVTPDEADVVNLRKILVQAADTWRRKSQKSDIAMRAMCIALSPGFDSTTTDPGRGRTLTLTSGLLGEDDLVEIGSLWPSLLNVMSESEAVPWVDIFDLLHKWLYPAMRVEPTESTREVMYDIVHGMLIDLIEFSKDYPGIQHKLMTIANRAEIELDVDLDDDFEILFPQEDVTFDKDHRADLLSAAKKKGKFWAEMDANIVAAKIFRLEFDARLADITYPRYTNIVCEEMSKHVSDPVAFATQFIKQKVTQDLLYPFIKRVVDSDFHAAHGLLHQCLESDRYRGTAISIVITMGNPPEDLLELMMQEVKNFVNIVDVYCLRGEVPELTLLQLFRSNEKSVSIAAAIGFWNATQNNGMPKNLYAEWRNVILQSDIDEQKNTTADYWLGEIFAKDGDLACEWLIAQVSQDDAVISYTINKIAKSTCSVLNRAQKIEIIRHVSAGYGSGKLISRLVGSDTEVYEALLGMKTLSRFHLSPLEGPVEPGWIEKVQIALDEGITPEKIASAVLPGNWFWSGDLSNMWDKRTKELEELFDHPDNRIARIARLAAEDTRKFREQALKEEHTDNVYGM